MVRIALSSLAALIAGVVARLFGLGSPIAALHLVFAVAVLPLIVAAMLHFVPVLNRSGPAHRLLARMPMALQGLGLGVVATLQGRLPYRILAGLAAVDASLLLILLIWVAIRMRRALGPAHPGGRWYLGALLCGVLALSGVVGLVEQPGQWRLWRLAHLHLNTLGLIGMAAFGTLPLLLPTALNRTDPRAAIWLKRYVWPWLTGALLLACAGRWPWLSVAGGVMLVAIVLHLLNHWRSTVGFAGLRADAIALSLFLAACGLAIQCLAGLRHAIEGASAGVPVPAFVVGFLLPLITAAASQLLPVWRWPGPMGPARRAMRDALASGAISRTLCWVLAGLALAMDAFWIGLASGVLGLAFFLPALARALRISRSTG